MACDGATLATLLAEEKLEQRATAYAALGAMSTDDDDAATIAVACVAPLVALLAQESAAVPRVEFCRVAGLLGRLVGIDVASVGAEWLQGDRWLASWRSSSNALHSMLAATPDELTRDDALLAAADLSALALVRTAGTSGIPEGWVEQCPYLRGVAQPAAGHDERRRRDPSASSGTAGKPLPSASSVVSRLSSLAVDLLRDDQFVDEADRLSSELVAGLWELISLAAHERERQCGSAAADGYADVEVAALRYGNAFFAPFYTYKNDPFTKTGSG
jgi:hypothetical protein